MEPITFTEPVSVLDMSLPDRAQYELGLSAYPSSEWMHAFTHSPSARTYVFPDPEFHGQRITFWARPESLKAEIGYLRERLAHANALALGLKAQQVASAGTLRQQEAEQAPHRAAMADEIRGYLDLPPA